MPRQDPPSLFTPDLVRHPFLHSLHREIDRVFDRFRDDDAKLEDLRSAGHARIEPALDVSESDDMVEITAELPGVAEADLDLSITDGVLSLKGEKRAEGESTGKDYHMIERRYGSFRRSVPLGFTPEDDKIEATFRDGVLRVRVMKPANAMARTRKIAVNRP